MKKTLLATAIAGALGASSFAAQAATVYNQDGTQFDIYGNLQLAYKSIDEGDSSEDEIFDNGSTIGFAGQHIINDGLIGYFKYEFEGDADEIKGDGGIDTGDQAYMGLKGNFGDVRLGSWDALMDDWIADPITNNEYFDVSDSSGGIFDFYGTDGTIDGGSFDREGDKLQYMSPSLGGLTFAVGTQYKGDAEESNGVVESDSRASFFGGAEYTFGAFSVAAVYDNLAIYDGTLEATGEEFEPGDQYGITGQYTAGALRVAVKAERFAGEEDKADVDFYGIGARYGYGYGDIYGAYQYVDAEENSYRVAGDDDSFNEVVIGATYNISPAMYTFIEGAMYDQQDDKGDGVAVGAVYSF